MGRVHGLAGITVVDGSVLPRSSRVNPALTIYAWSLRAADRLALRLRDNAELARPHLVSVSGGERLVALAD